MALTRKMLRAMSIEDEKIDQIIEAHAETVDALKTERDEYKDAAEKLPEVEKLLEQANEAVKNNGDAEWKTKYDELKTEYDNYKTEQQNAAAKTAKQNAYKEALKEAGISDKRFDAILRVTDLENIELDSEGKIKEVEKLVESIKTEWSDFVVTEGERGADPANPPKHGESNTFAEMSLAEKMTYANEHPNAAEVTDWLNSK